MLCALQSEVSCMEPRVASGTRPCGGSMESWHQQTQTAGAECPGDGACWAHPQPIRSKRLPGVCRSVLRWSRCPGGGAGVETVRGRSSPGELAGTWFALSPGQAWRAWTEIAGGTSSSLAPSAHAGARLATRDQVSSVSPCLPFVLPRCPGYRLRLWEEGRRCQPPREQLG